MTAGHGARPRARPATRPRNRRALIIAAANELFYRDGYAHVSMGKIARAVEVGPSALYRHFTGKQQLLREVLQEHLAVFREVLTALDLGAPDNDPSSWAALASEQRELGVLWQRESRHLSHEDRSSIRREIRSIGKHFSGQLRARRPELNSATADLLTWIMFSMLTSMSFHRLSLPRREHVRLFNELTETVLDSPAPTGFSSPPAPSRESTLVPHARREALLVQAIHMFAEHGYARVGIEDIGAGLGSSGASIYKHFPNKLDMLVTASNRGITWLRMDLSRVLGVHTGCTGALRELVRCYIHFALAHHDLVGLLITEQEHLPDDERERCRQAQFEYLDEWVRLLRGCRPRLEPTPARIRVYAVLSTINSIARTPHLRRNPGTPAALAQVCDRMLELPPG